MAYLTAAYDLRTYALSLGIASLALALIFYLIKRVRSARPSPALAQDSRQAAMLDSLTGLLNRLGFEVRLEHAVARVDRASSSSSNREKIAVLFIDIDGFKPVHESLGHAGSDEVVCEVARRVCSQVRAGDAIARLGGDQFLILMEGVVSADTCTELAVRVQEAVKVPFHVAERRVQISVSIGIVIYPDQGEAHKLLARADTAMQAAKRAGRGTYAMFASHMHKGAADQLDLIGELRQAIERGEMELHYQPKIDGLRGVICGVEALLRWTHPVHGSISPAVFIPIAEQFGYINTLGDWVIEEACRQMHSWAQSGVQMRVAINLSVHQLNEIELVSRISAALRRHGVKSSQLLCEITESVAMQDINATQRTLDALGRIGVYLSIDDFGTGYSSLSYLRQLPARQLKIDRSFINDLDTGNHARAVVDAVVRLAHALGLRVVAEGVETARQRDILLELGCDELQGYFFAHPMPADSLLEWTAGKKPKGTVDFARSLVFDPVGRESVDA
ncbi:MAG: putative bifunctional diguanylate cyclase/phosphodiesterase [Burkholderiaceae bacterium]